MMSEVMAIHPPPRRTVTFGNAAGRLKERGDDVYPTPSAAVEALLRAETLPHHLWEPAWPSDAAGGIAAVLRAHGHRVTCSDLRGDRIDFLMERRAPEGVEGIVTNAPFKLSAEFVRHGLTLVPMFVLFQRINFLESAHRADIIDGGRLARVHLFIDRLPKMHREGWRGARMKSEGAAYAWFVFHHDHVGPTTIDRIWCRHPAPHVLHTMRRESEMRVLKFTDTERAALIDAGFDIADDNESATLGMLSIISPHHWRRGGDVEAKLKLIIDLPNGNWIERAVGLDELSPAADDDEDAANDGPEAA